MKRAFFVLLLSSAIVDSPAQHEAVRGRRPLAPHVLITVLPDPPEGWKTVRSTAETRFGDWLETYAVRVFENIPEQSSEEPPQRTTISFLDTAAFPGTTAMFDDFRPGEEENYEKRMIRNYPTFLIQLGEDQHETILLVEGRFLVTIFIENQPKRTRRKWLDTLDMSALESIPEGELIQLPEILQMVEIDQLNPKRNRIYSLAISTDMEPGEDCEADE